LYAGVRIGAWAATSLPEQSISRSRLLFRKNIGVPFSGEPFLKGKLSDISNEMKILPGDASIEQLDAVIANHIMV
jgi:hypothetical protein